MILYMLYRIGNFLASVLPLKASYAIACLLADIYRLVSPKERRAVITNVKMVLGKDVDGKDADRIAREVFRNFGKYLTDFFRFSRINKDYIRKLVRMEGLENIDLARSKGKGAVILSAHFGNWELGGAALSLAGYPLSAVVLTHQNKRINDFFTRQRQMGKMKPIEIGLSLKACYTLLRANKLLALLGDRDFTKNGLYVEFFGHPTLIPKGPATFSYRIGSAIVPAFMVREPDDSFRLVFEKPIFPDHSKDEKEAIMDLTKKHLSVIESYVRRYPSQWYVFREIWNENGKDLHPDTVI